MTAAGSFASALKAEDANVLFSEILSGIAKECMKEGALMIGHIKANVRSGGEMLSLSCTTGDGNVRPRSSFTKDVRNYSMTMNVIVYGTERRRTAEIAVSNIKKALGSVITEVYSEAGCEDPGCDDPMCRNEDHKRIIDIR